MTNEEIREAVEASSFLNGSGLEPESIAVKNCRRGQIISDRQRGQAILGLIAKGNVDVYSIAMDGREILLSQLSQGDCFGIVNLFTDTELPTVLKCRSDTTLLVIPKARLQEAMAENRELALRYAGLCNRKMQFLIRKIEFLTMQSGRKKLIQYLLTQPEKTGTAVRLWGSKDELASLLGISRASLFRELSKLQESGLIGQESGAIEIRDREGLERILYGCE